MPDSTPPHFSAQPSARTPSRSRLLQLLLPWSITMADQNPGRCTILVEPPPQYAPTWRSAAELTNCGYPLYSLSQRAIRDRRDAQRGIQLCEAVLDSLPHQLLDLPDAAQHGVTIDAEVLRGRLGVLT